MGSDDLLYLSRYDGLHHFRLNALGAYCLGIAEAYEASTPASRAALTLYPDLSIHADTPLSPDERTLLETYAAVEADGVWRLDLDRALAAIEVGHDPTSCVRSSPRGMISPCRRPSTASCKLRNAGRER